MADVNVDFDPQFEARLVAASLSGLRRLRDDILHDMQAAVPVGETGDLKRSLFCEVNERTGDITGGATADYADDVELGHEARDGSHVPAQPFVRPAFLRKRGDY